jgi:hypothetical protein
MPCEKQLAYCVKKTGARDFVILQNGELVKAEIVDSSVNGAMLGYLPHWGNCPGAKGFRGR